MPSSFEVSDYWGEYIERMSSLTIFQLLLTGIVELGLGFIAYIGFCKIVPWMRRKADLRYSYWRTTIASSNILYWVFAPFKYSPSNAGLPLMVKIEKPEKMKLWVLWAFLQGAVFLLAELLPTFILITSVGWKLPFLQNLYYNLLFATANGAPNGAHITSYLCVMATMLFIAWKTRDVFLGILGGAFLVGLHEGIWIVFYYLGYWQFINASMITNVVKDWPIFTGMIVLFIYSFEKYPFNHWHLKDFKIPIVLFAVYVALWFFIPHLFFGYSNWLPIRTANLPNSAITTTQYNKTPWFWDPYVNALEVFSWFFLYIGLMTVFVKANSNRLE